jgi:hypothetical protein
VGARFTKDHGTVVLDTREPEHVEAGLEPRNRGHVYRICLDHRVGWRTRVWQFFCPECFRLWLASCSNYHNNNIPCFHCYDFGERRQKHEDEGWMLTCPGCAKGDRGEPVEAPKPKTAGRGGWGAKRGPRSTKVTGPIISFKL